MLTGKFTEFKRADAEAALERLGATVGSSVNNKTDILFVGARAGSKLAKAKSLDIPVHDEATLAVLVAGAPEAGAEAETVDPSTPKEDTPVVAFAGKVIALTGTFTTMKRTAAKKVLQEAGASVGSSVTKKTELLVYGENAGSKLEKARGLGVALMTEAEMVALLSAGGAGSDELAGASEKLAQKKAKAAANATPLTKVAEELRVFVGALEAREGLNVTLSKIGRKAGKAKTDRLRRAGLPGELVDFYAEMDGIHVEWNFIGSNTCARIRVPPVSRWTAFTGDDDHYMDFGEHKEALLLDEITPEGATWLVRDKDGGGDDVSIIFASAAEGPEGVFVTSSVAEYLRQALASGFVHYWPRCFGDNPNVSYAEFEATLERFRAPPVPVEEIAVQRRVEFGYFSERGRGEVLVIHEAPPSELTKRCGSAFSRVQLDEGTVAWMPNGSMTVVAQEDAYERLREPSFDLSRTAKKGDLDALLDDLVRAIGPMTSRSSTALGELPSTARRAMGVLFGSSLGRALKDVLDIYAAAKKAGYGLEDERKLEKNGDEFGAAELDRAGWSYTTGELFEGLFGGLLLLAHWESFSYETEASELIDNEKIAKRLGKVELGATLLEHCSREGILEEVDWSVAESSKLAETLGLPEGVTVFIGEGY